MNLKMQSEHLGLRPDTRSLVSYGLDFWEKTRLKNYKLWTVSKNKCKNLSPRIKIGPIR